MLMLVSYAGALFWLLPIFLTGDAIQRVMNAVVFGIATAVLYTWGGAAYYAMRGNITGVHQHIVSTVAVWFIVWVQRLYSITFLVLERPHWMLISAFPAFVTYMFGMMGVFIVIAPAFVEDVDKTDYFKQIGIGVTLGVIAAAVAYVIQLTA
jgi:hypothetical protein